MEAAEHEENRRLSDASGEGDTGSQGSVHGTASRSHLPDQQTHRGNCISKDCAGNYTPPDPGHRFPGRVEGRRYADRSPQLATRMGWRAYLRELAR